MTRLHVVRTEDHDGLPWLVGIALTGVLGALALRWFGLPGVDLHGPLHRSGIMDPFCGGTRATLVLSRGDVAGAWSWNPLVVLLAAVILLVLARAVMGTVTKRWVNLYLPRRYAVGGLVVLMIIIAINQQMQADRLMNVVPS